MDHKQDVALLREAVDAWLPRDGPVVCAMTIAVPDGRVFEFDAIPRAITPDYGDLLGFELTVQSTTRFTKRGIQ